MAENSPSPLGVILGRIFDDDVGDSWLSAILHRLGKVVGTPAPRTSPPRPEAKLEQQLGSPITQEASAREPIVDTRRKGAPFANRGFSEHTIRNMVASRINAPERLLYLTETELKKIPGIEAKSMAEIKAYRARFIPKGSLPKGSLPRHPAELIVLILCGLFAGFVAYVLIRLII